MVITLQLRNTLLAIACALAPGFFRPAGEEQEASAGAGTRAGLRFQATTHGIVAVLQNPESVVQPGGALKVLFPHTLPPAAPFLLFRLKRSGYSACRVTVLENGLLLAATR
jgi:hypothetical protein